jgi:hypothetical protein
MIIFQVNEYPARRAPLPLEADSAAQAQPQPAFGIGRSAVAMAK